MIYFKALNKGRVPPMQSASPPWPVKGEWTEKRYVSLCHSGWHVTTAKSLGNWMDYDELWLVECRGKSDKGSDKIAFEQARLVRKLDNGRKMRCMMIKELNRLCKANKINIIRVFGSNLTEKSNFAYLYSCLISYFYNHDKDSGQNKIAKEFLTKLFTHWNIKVDGFKSPCVKVQL